MSVRVGHTWVCFVHKEPLIPIRITTVSSCSFSCSAQDSSFYYYNPSLRSVVHSKMRYRTLEIRWHDSKPISTCDFQPVPFKKARPMQEKNFAAQSYRLATGGEDNHVRVSEPTMASNALTNMDLKRYGWCTRTSSHLLLQKAQMALHHALLGSNTLQHLADIRLL